jgi:hypothetical protein
MPRHAGGWCKKLQRENRDLQRDLQRDFVKIYMNQQVKLSRPPEFAENSGQQARHGVIAQLATFAGIAVAA